jgi:hypothetical protein
MKRQTLNCVKEPRDIEYGALLASLAPHCSEALLVLRDDIGLSPGANELLEVLTAHGSASKRARSWPGTELMSNEATVVRMPLTQSTLQLLTGAVSGLFDWIQPARPEDLCLLRADGSPLLVSVAHERDAYLELRPSELKLIARVWSSVNSHFATVQETGTD